MSGITYHRTDTPTEAGKKGFMIGAHDARDDLPKRHPPLIYDAKQQQSWKWCYDEARSQLGTKKGPA